MCAKINKAQKVYDYIVKNIETLIDSKKSYNELFNDFIKISKIKVSQSLFYNVFNKVLNDKNLTRERPKKNKKRNQKNNNKKQQLNNDSEQSNDYNTESEQSEDNNKLRPVSPEEAAALLDSSSSSSESFKDNEEESEEDETAPTDAEQSEESEDDENKPLYSNVHITPDGNYEKFLRERGHKTLGIFDEILPRTTLIIDVSKRFKIHEKLYAPVVLFISKGIPLTNEEYNLKANEEYNKTIKTNLINVIRIPFIEYSHKFYNVYPPHCFVNYFLPFIDSCYRKDKLILHNLHYKKSEDVIPIYYI